MFIFPFLFLPPLTIFPRLQIDRMEFFQEPTFTALMALILSLVVAKIVSFAVFNCSSDGDVVAGSGDEGAVAKEVTLNKGLRVGSAEGIKRVKFVDDVVIRRVDRNEGSENPVLLGDAESSGEGIVEEKIVGEESGGRVDQLGLNKLNEDSGGKVTEEQCCDVREISDADAQEQGCEIAEMVIEKECDGDNVDGFFSAKEKKNEEELEGDDVVTDQRDEDGTLSYGGNERLARVDEEEGKLRYETVDDDDDWEGIERNDLERVFAEAVNYVEYGGKKKDKDNDQLATLGSDVQMQLYGLHKVAVEGPCNEPQPMALKVSARAKWNAWQRLGSMSQEVAMEQYIRVLSDNVPGWMQDYSADDDVQGSPNLETVGRVSVPKEGEYESSATPIGDPGTGRSPVESVQKDDNML